ncbi:MAG: winged helix-turn-helix transcriptional regulator [Nitrososphaera sp.]
MNQIPEIIGTKAVLLAQIGRNPGIRYRELLRLTGLANGVLTYHLSGLEKAHHVNVERRSKMTRYYPLSVSERESTILRYIRHEPVRRIVLFLLEDEHCTFTEIVDHMKKAPSTISLHLKRLREDGVVSVRYGEYHLYRLSNRELVEDVLSMYRASFVDKVVDGYAEIMEDL